MSNEFEQFHVIDQRQRELTRLDSEVVFYATVPLREFRDDVLSVMNAFYGLCPPGTLRWYLTETMKQFGPITQRSLTLPQLWWKDGAPRKALRELAIKDGLSHSSLATWGMNLRSAEPENKIFEKKANYLRFVFPPEFFYYNHNEFLQFVLAAADRLPYISGHGGLVIECNPYYPDDAEAISLPLAMRFQAVDVGTLNRSAWAVRSGKIKNVAPITCVGWTLLNPLGGINYLKKQLTQRVKLFETKHGVVIQIDEQPTLGDIELGELKTYVETYRVLSRLHSGIDEAFGVFSLRRSSDPSEATRRWLYRFRRS